MILEHLLLPLLYAALFFFAFPNKILYAEFVAGIYFGFSIFFLDRILHVFFVQPDTEFSQMVRAEWKKKHLGQVFKLFILGRKLQDQLITRSALFLIAYLAMALFILTSTGSVLGAGVVLGIGLHFCFDFYRYRQNLAEFHQHFLWQIKRKLADQEVNALVIGFCCFFVLLSLLVIK